MGGLPDVVEDGKTGYLVPPEDDNALAEAVIKVLQDPEAAQRMGEYGRHLVETRFAWRVLAERMKRAFEGLIAKTRTGVTAVQPDQSA